MCAFMYVCIIVHVCLLLCVCACACACVFMLVRGVGGRTHDLPCLSGSSVQVGRSGGFGGFVRGCRIGWPFRGD